MLKRVSFAALIFLLVGMFAYQVNPTAASPSADCESFFTDEVLSTPVTVNFNCGSAAPTYFGVCDSGPALDDYFNIEYNGGVVASNNISGANEIVSIGSAVTTAGANVATINRTAGGGTATYSYGISTDLSAVQSYLNANCGTDYTVSSGCGGVVELFTQDEAPSDGTLEFHMLFGNEGARGDELIMMTWDITEGQQLNNVPVSNLTAPRYARVWWQPDGSSEWYLLTSQYWNNSGDRTSEYGITCGGGQPSYHTSFASAVPEANVCFNLLEGCN